MLWREMTHEERVEYIKSRRGNGETWEEIRTALHVSRNTLFKFRRHLPIEHQMQKKDAPPDPDTATDQEMIEYITKRREKRASWCKIASECGCRKERVIAYRGKIPAHLRRNLSRWDNLPRVGHCPQCGWETEDSGICELCNEQARGRIIFYRDMEALHM